MSQKHIAPKRYGRALRRLLFRRTSSINVKHAEQFVRDKLVVVVSDDATPCAAAGKGRTDLSSVRKNKIVRLTWRGYLYASLTAVGWNPYGEGRALSG